MQRDSSAGPWWVDAVTYQVYPRSFADANRDGTGDLAGVISRLPYIAALGVDAVWLSPFYPSLQHDSGYDVSNPRDVDPMYGTVDDARELIKQAHARGLRVIVDIVPNHFSTEHPWFAEAVAAGPGSPARTRFHFRPGRGAHGDEPPNNWLSLFTGPAWTRATEADGSPGEWYLNMFDSTQIDLNWTHPDVRADFIGVPMASGSMSLWAWPRT
jgi:alpha-glucosidase